MPIKNSLPNATVVVVSNATFLTESDRGPRNSSCQSECSAVRGLLANDLVILNHSQMTRMAPDLEPASPNYPTSPTGGV
ncbi:hypothetical protein TNCV_2943321 [Trichonephila clavipes]|nr:hypothetical protein TNCV_2943321 [Trichonephila clavipes]